MTTGKGGTPCAPATSRAGKFAISDGFSTQNFAISDIINVKTLRLTRNLCNFAHETYEVSPCKPENMSQRIFKRKIYQKLLEWKEQDNGSTLLQTVSKSLIR